MLHFQISIRQMLIWIVPSATAVAMFARAATSWGPMNLVVLAGFVLIAAEILACLPSIQHRPFWAGLGGFGLLYALIIAPASMISGNFALLPVDRFFRGLAGAYYGPGPNPHWDFEAYEAARHHKEHINSFVLASHAVTAMGVGILGGCLLVFLAKLRESRRWDRQALPERSLEEFLLQPLKIDRPLDSK